MNTKTFIGGAIAGLVIAGGTVGAISAQTAAVETGLSEEQIIAIALAEVQGEVLEIELETEDGMQIYEVEILGEDGMETELEIAANTGEILDVEAEDDDDDDDDCKKDRKKT